MIELFTEMRNEFSGPFFFLSLEEGGLKTTNRISDGFVEGFKQKRTIGYNSCSLYMLKNAH